MFQRSLIRIVVLAILVFATTALCDENTNQASQVPPSETASKATAADSELLHNLQTAYITESNEVEQYTAFGKKADEEGYGQVASLFRALANAEQIHSANKAELTRDLGGEAHSKPEPFEVLSTIENLDRALQAEKYEQETMYPQYASQADKANYNEVQQAYKYCLSSEQRHLLVLKQAHKNLGDYTGANVDFFVCTKCGNTVRSLNFDECPVCKTPKTNFTAVR